MILPFVVYCRRHRLWSASLTWSARGGARTPLVAGLVGAVLHHHLRAVISSICATHDTGTTNGMVSASRFSKRRGATGPAWFRGDPFTPAHGGVAVGASFSLTGPQQPARVITTDSLVSLNVEGAHNCLIMSHVWEHDGSEISQLHTHGFVSKVVPSHTSSHSQDERPKTP